MKKKPVAYLAGPLGFSEVGRLFHETKMIPMLTELGFDILDPWQLTPFEQIKPILDLPYGQEKKEAWEKMNRIIGQKNEDAIRASDILVAVLDGVDVDSGTASEIGAGGILGKPTFGYRGDFRLSADNEGGIVNLQVEHFIYSRGGVIVSELEALRGPLARFRDEFLKKQLGG